jgi:predicted nuclease of predicted toxin-antitoxin system
VPTYLIDENLPRSLAPGLRTAGFEVEDVRDQCLRGRPDTEVLSLSLSRGWVLITGDLGFGSLVRTAPSFPGMLLIRLPDEWPTDRVNEVIRKALEQLREHPLTNSLAVVEPDRIRIHLVAKNARTSRTS